MFFRLLNYVLFLSYALLRSLTLPRHDVVCCWTDPPVIGAIAALVKRIKGSQFLFVSQDVYPEVLVGMGKLNVEPIVRTMSAISRFILSSADRVVVIGSDMAKRIYAKGVPIHRVAIIPNWQDLETLRPDSGASFREAQGISKDTFVVMHSGNIGLSQDFESLFAAAVETKDQQSILYIIIGSGQRRVELERAVQSQQLGNVRFLPYQPENQLGASLGSANVHYVSLKPALTGAIVPSKIYGIMAVGRAILANMSPESDVARIVQESGCGGVVSGQSLAKSIREMAANPDRTNAMGEKGRKWAEQHGGRPRAIRAYLDVIASCA